MTTSSSNSTSCTVNAQGSKSNSNHTNNTSSCNKSSSNNSSKGTTGSSSASLKQNAMPSSFSKSGKKKRQSSGRNSSSKGHFFNNSSNSNNASGSNSNSNSNFPLPFTLPPELAAHYLSLSQQQQQQQLSQAGKGSSTTVFGPSPPPPSDDASGNNLNASSNSSNPSNCSGPPAPCSEAEMKALMSMFVDIMGMSMDSDKQQRTFGRDSIVRLNMAAAAAAAAGNNNTNSLGGSNNNNPNNPFPVFSMMFGGSAAAAAAAAANGTPWPTAAQEEWMMDYYEDDSLEEDEEEDEDEEEEEDGCSEEEEEASSRHVNSKTSLASTDSTHLQFLQSSAAAAQLLREEEDNEEERARKAAKKREKKNRKKEKAKREAALKAAQAAQKRREKSIQSWRSRVVSACSSAELPKLDNLLSETPFQNQKSTITEDYDKGNGGTTREQELEQNMEWLLPSCVQKTKPIAVTMAEHQQIACSLLSSLEKQKQPAIPKSITSSKNDVSQQARSKLSFFIMSMSFHVVLLPKNKKSTLHLACAMGDFSFVYLTISHAQYQSNTDIHSPCQDSGWTPLHYAAAYGYATIVELLLSPKGGADVSTTTNPNLTNHNNNKKRGVSVRELVESLSRDDVDSINCEGEALQDVLEFYKNSSSHLHQTNLKLLQKRLEQIERNGYTEPPLSETSNSNTITSNSNNKSVESSSSSKSTTVTNNTTSSSNSKKKKKKKKKSGQQSESTTPVQPPAPRKKAEDPLITALLGMGFSREQIDAAVQACGGTNRATADDLVVWILENGADNTDSNNNTTTNTDDSISNSPPISNSTQPSSTTRGQSVSNNQHQEEEEIPPNHNSDSLSSNINNVSSQAVAIQIMQQQQQRAALQAQKEAMEAAKRTAAAQAAAERLAAKREEQRRIRREWNEREQLRQKEKTESRLVEEMEKHRRMEIEKAKMEAQRLVKERAAAHHQVDHHHHHHHMLHPNHTTNSSNNTNHNAGSTLLFPTMYPSDNRPDGSVLTPNAPVYQPSNAMYHAPIELDKNNPYATIPQAYNNNDYVGFNEGHKSIMRKKQQHPEPDLEVNPYDFPELGKDKEQPSRPNRSSHKNSESPKLRNAASRNKQQRNVKQPKQTNNKSKKLNIDSAPLTSSNHINSNNNMTPPGFQSSSSNSQESYESNPLGEIRATAKEFVPSFAPAFQPPNSTPNPASMSAQPVPPGLSHFSGNNSNAVQPQMIDTSSLYTQQQDTAAALLEPVNSLLITSQPQPILGTNNNDHSLDHSNHYVMNNSNITGHSPVASVASSVTGLSASGGGTTISAPDNNNDHLIASRVGSVMSFDTHQSGSGVSKTANFLDSITPLGTIDPPSTNLGGNIWGASNASSATAAGAFAGFSSFNFPEANDNTRVSDITAHSDSNQNDNNNNNTWGVGHTLLNPNGNGGIGSIW